MTPEQLRSQARKVGANAPIPQRQDGLDEQLADLHRLAVLFGLYDADDWMFRIYERQQKISEVMDRAEPVWRPEGEDLP